MIATKALTSVCEFCDELNGHPTRYSNLYGDTLPVRQIVTTEHFVLLPSLGQIVEGYCLIVSKSHHTAISNLTEDELRDLKVLIRRTRSALMEAYGMDCVFFEHGVPCGDSSGGGCGIYHLHLHAVPISTGADLFTQISEEHQFEQVVGLNALRHHIPDGTTYLLFIDEQDRCFTRSVDVIPSQYMRQQLATVVGQQEWNWRDVRFETRLVDTYATVRYVVEVQERPGQ